jgi:hypothetical protein
MSVFLPETADDRAGVFVADSQHFSGQMHEYQLA